MGQEHAPRSTPTAMTVRRRRIPKRYAWREARATGARVGERTSNRAGPLPSSAMTTEIDAIRSAVLEGAPGDALAALPLPEAVRGALVRADEQEMFAGLPSEEKDPRKSTHVEEFPFPEIAPDEVVIAVMASSINFNTVW